MRLIIKPLMAGTAGGSTVPIGGRVFRSVAAHAVVGVAFVAASLLVVSAPGAAQRGQQPPRIQSTKPSSTKTDTTGIRRTPAGFMLDFPEQDIKFVLSAIAEA